MQAAGPNLTASNTPTSLLNAQAKTYLKPGFFDRPGKAVLIEFAGQLGNIVTTPGTLTLDVRMGPTSNIIVFNGAAMQLSSTAHTALPIEGRVKLTCRSIGNGTTATLMGQGRVTAQALSLTAVADSTTTPATLLMPNTTPAVGTGFDSTVAMVVDLFGTFSLNNANAIQIHQYELYELN
ncbi:MAG: hypothetical protein V4515_12745 [Chloroflexota bacterium]